MIYLIFLLIYLIAAIVLYNAYLIVRLKAEDLIIANRVLRTQNKIFMDTCAEQKADLLRLRASHVDLAMRLNDLRLSLVGSTDTQQHAEQEIAALQEKNKHAK